MSGLKYYLKSVLVAVQFLTQVPVHFKHYPEKQAVGSSLLFYPLVGLLIGLFITCLALSLSTIPTMLNSAMVLTAWVGITGALHIDGLADSCDAWVGGQGDRLRTLQIMKDPSSGPVAVVMLICHLLLKVFAIDALLTLQQFELLIIAPLVARTLLPILLLITPYVRANGIGAMLVDNAPRKKVYVSCLLTGLMGFTLFEVNLVFFSILTASVSLFCLRSMMLNRLHGLTGDTAGASIEIVEVVVLLTLVVLVY